jgi:hypothetical protein
MTTNGIGLDRLAGPLRVAEHVATKLPGHGRARPAMVVPVPVTGITCR